MSNTKVRYLKRKIVCTHMCGWVSLDIYLFVFCLRVRNTGEFDRVSFVLKLRTN